MLLIQMLSPTPKCGSRKEILLANGVISFKIVLLSLFVWPESPLHFKTWRLIFFWEEEKRAKERAEDLQKITNMLNNII